MIRHLANHGCDRARRPRRDERDAFESAAVSVSVSVAVAAACARRSAPTLCRRARTADGARHPQLVARPRLSSVAWRPPRRRQRRGAATSAGRLDAPLRLGGRCSPSFAVAAARRRWYATPAPREAVRDDASAQWRHEVLEASRNAAAARTLSGRIRCVHDVGSLSYRKARDASTARRQDVRVVAVSVSLGDAASDQGPRMSDRKSDRARRAPRVAGRRRPERRHRHVAGGDGFVPSQRLDGAARLGRGGRRARIGLR